MRIIFMLLLLMGQSPLFVHGNRTIAFVPTCVSGACSDSFVGTSGTTLNTHDTNWKDYDPSLPASNIALSGSGSAHCCSDGNGFHMGGGYYNSSTSDTSQLVILPYTDGAVAKSPCVRGSGTPGYCAGFSNANAGNWTKVTFSGTGSFITIEGSWSQSINHTVKITASGTGTVGLTVTVDGTSLGTFTDTGSTLNTGHPGFYISGDGNDVDNYVGPWQDH